MKNREISQSSAITKKDLPQRILIAMLAATLAFGGATMVACNGNNSGETSGNGTEAGQTTGDSTGEEGVDSGEITEGPNVTTENPAGETNTGLPEGIPEPENMNPTHPNFEEVKALAIKHAQFLLSGYNDETTIHKIMVFHERTPDGYVIMIKKPDGTFGGNDVVDPYSAPGNR